MTMSQEDSRGPGAGIHGCRKRQGGITFIEVIATLVVIVILLGSLVGTTLGTQNVFLQDQAVSELHLRAERTMDRLVELVSQALTYDPQFTPLLPGTGIGSHGLRFRLTTGIDSATGAVIYDDAAQVYLLGADSGPYPCKGIIVGRGPDLATILAAGGGPDATLGTEDDNTSAILASGVPAVELLLPFRFAPEVGDALAITITPAPVGRLVTLTVRVNATGRDGSYILPTDLQIVERVALRQ